MKTISFLLFIASIFFAACDSPTENKTDPCWIRSKRSGYASDGVAIEYEISLWRDTTIAVDQATYNAYLSGTIYTPCKEWTK